MSEYDPQKLPKDLTYQDLTRRLMLKYNNEPGRTDELLNMDRRWRILGKKMKATAGFVGIKYI